MLCHVGKRMGGAGPQLRQLPLIGQWDVHSIPCDAMTSILMGAAGVWVGCCSLGTSGVELVSSCVTCGLFWLFIPPSPAPGFHAFLIIFLCVIVAVVVIIILF